ncbi:MAG TPA: hypothetical protein VH085_12585 [Nocardioides sp.]|jgi:hypothetical protein|nr:hypothetical protein [Nocardioides sp.]
MKAPHAVTGVRATLRLALWATLVLVLLAPPLYSAAAHAYLSRP